MHGALQRLKARRANQSAMTEAEAPARSQSKHLAAASDDDNAAYLQQMQKAFAEMSAQPQHSSHIGQIPPAFDSQAIGASSCTSVSNDVPSATASRETRSNSSTKNSTSHISTRACRPSSKAASLLHPSACSAAAGLGREPARTCTAASAVAAAAAGPTSQLAASCWTRGPKDTAGVLVQLSERPLLCSAALWPSQQVVLGSSDHALYVVDVAAARRIRTLYSKTCGHTEWVTSVTYLPGGQLLSGGMDGRLWLWPTGSGSSGSEVKAAHDAPVSQLAALRGLGGAAVSCSYDKTVKIWNVGSAGSSSSSRVREVAVLRGHRGPVLELAVQPAAAQPGLQMLTGDRTGGLMCWDLGSASNCWGVAASHQGHVTAIAWLQQGVPDALDGGSSSSSSHGWCALSGGQDGCLRVWDGRSGAAVAERAVHADARGRGAVGSIITGCGSSQQLVMTAGADQRLAVLEPRMSWSLLHTVQLTDFPYTLAAGHEGSGLAVCGCGDGSVHVVDVDQGQTLYALGAGKAGAIRAVEVSAGRLVCAGDDGYVMLYSFE